MVDVKRPAVAVRANDNAAHPTVRHSVHGFAGDSAGPKVDSAVKVVVAQLRELA